MNGLPEMTRRTWIVPVRIVDGIDGPAMSCDGSMNAARPPFGMLMVCMIVMRDRNKATRTVAGRSRSTAVKTTAQIAGS